MTRTMVAETRPEVALADLGVKPELLTADERRSLDIDGFVILEDVIPEETIRYIREHIDAKLDSQRVDTATEEDIRRRAGRRMRLFERILEQYEARLDDGFLEEDTTRESFEERLASFKQTVESVRSALATDDVPALRAVLQEGLAKGDSDFIEDDLFESDPVFDLTISSARVLTAVAYILGPMFHILNLVSRCPRPGQGQQALHRTPYSARRIATTIWLMDDMTLENGPTRLVPGSHLLSDGLPTEMEGDATRTHPDEIKVVAPAGSVVVFDDRCWHGGSLHNGGGGPRRVVISSFTQRDLSQSMAVNHPEETLARLSPGQCWLLHPKLEAE